MSAENASTPGSAGAAGSGAGDASSGSDSNTDRAPGPENAFGGPADEDSGARGLLKGAGIVAVALGMVQVSAYLLSVAGARLLPPSEFGALASLLNLVAIGSVVAFGLQAVAARLIVQSDPASRSAIGARLLRFSWLVGAILALAVIAVSPVITGLLDQSGLLVTALVGLALLPITLAGGLYGIAQGREQHLRLGLLLVVTGLARFLGGVLGLLVFGTVFGTIAVMTLGALIGALVAVFMVRPITDAAPLKVDRLTSQVLHASHAMFALFVATSIDLLLARYFLPGPESGVYAVGAVVAKVAFWLPQFVAVIAFPRMADDRRERTTAVAAAAVAAIGVLIVLGLVLVPNVVISFVGGSQYASLAGSLWIFGVIGAAFALAQFLLYSRLAVDDRRAVYALWAAVIAIVAGVSLWHGGVAQVASVVAAVALLLAGVGVAALLIDRRQGAEHPIEGFESLERG